MTNKALFVVMAVLYLVIIFPPLPIHAEIETHLTFYQNTGQWDTAILYKAELPEGTIWITHEGFYLISSTVDSLSILQQIEYPIESEISLTHLVVGMKLLNTNPDASVTGNIINAPVVHYYYGNTQKQWHTNIPAVNEITITDIYPGINLRLYESENHFAYDFILSPEADVSLIEMQFTGTENISLASTGELQLSTILGDIIQTEPYAFLEQDKTTALVSSFHILDKNKVGFLITIPDNQTTNLIIDPKLYFSTYFGGSSIDDFNDIFVDSDGYSYVTGYTQSPNFPLMEAFDSTFSECCPFNIVISKFNPEGNSLVFSTYFSGITAEWDRGTSIVVDADGNIYICGTTSSATFPKLNAWDDSFNGSEDGVIVKLDSTGQLLFSTVFGGTNFDGFTAIALDHDGNIILTGYTYSSDLPLMNPYDDSFNGGSDVMVVKFSSDGSTLLSATYLGGSADDTPTDIAYDINNNMYVCGQTVSTNYPVQNPFQAIRNGTAADAFLSVISADGSILLTGTYFGGSGVESCRAIRIDSLNQVFIVGTTASVDLPLINPFENSLSGGSDCFLACFRPTGDTLVYASYFGGSLGETGWDLKLNNDNEVVLLVGTNSINVPMVNAYDSIYNGGNTDVLIIRYSPSLNSITYSTYFGGSGRDTPHRFSVDSINNIYLTGSTTSVDFPTRLFYDNSINSTTDAFISKLATQFFGCCLGSTGNIDGDSFDATDIADLLYFVNFVFDNPPGPPPVCLEEADVDGSATVDIADILYLVDYMFAVPSGPAPKVCP